MPDRLRSKHVFKPSPLFYEKGDKLILRDDPYDPPYQHIFKLKLWLSLSLLMNFALGMTVYYLVR